MCHSLSVFSQLLTRLERSGSFSLLSQQSNLLFLLHSPSWYSLAAILLFLIAHLFYLLQTERKIATFDSIFYYSRKCFQAAAEFYLLFPSSHFLKGPICLLLPSIFPFCGLSYRDLKACSGLTLPKALSSDKSHQPPSFLHFWGGHCHPQEDTVLSVRTRAPCDAADPKPSDNETILTFCRAWTAKEVRA